MLKKSFSVNKLASAFIVLLLCLSVFCGCTADKGGTKPGESLSFTDALGREVTVPYKPQRVAALIGSFAEVWMLAGGEICATAEDAWTDFGLDLPSAVNIGGAHSPSLELLISAEPELVIASASTAADVEMERALCNMGIAVAYFDVDCFDDYLSMLDICTDITGRKDLFEKNGADLKKCVDENIGKVKSAQLSRKERTVLLLRASSGFVKAKGSEGTVLGEMLRELGLINIADNDKNLLQNLNVESVIRSEPYRIFVVTMGDDTEKAKENFQNMLKLNPAWGELGAVKENRVHIMDRRLFNIKPNEKWAESYEQLSKILLS